jgi:tripartite-type tricarboxylate transporter receptor subunit TctC
MIKAMIFDHEIAPGSRVNIDSLSVRLEVSQTPVREALARPDIRAKMEAKGNPPRPAGPEEFAAAMRAEIVLTERMMKVARIEAE